MVQTRRTVNGPQILQSQQLPDGDSALPIQPRGDNPALATILPWVGMDSNYNDETAADGSQSELTQLRLENQALQLLLREHLNKSISV